jgi:hypothetical protein
MYKVFNEFAQKLGVPIRHITAHTSFFRNHLKSQDGVDSFFSSLANSDRYYIIFDGMSQFGKISSPMEKYFRGIRLVRSPVSVICSAARYHSWSEERWLHIPKQEFNGYTYQQAISSLPTSNERYRFEMSNSALNTIRHMASFGREGYFKTVHYEQLIKDESTTLFHNLLEYLGFDDREARCGLEAFYANSIFGGLKPEEQKHVQTSDDADYGADWDGETIALYREKIASFAERIGYGLGDDLSPMSVSDKGSPE